VCDPCTHTCEKNAQPSCPEDVPSLPDASADLPADSPDTADPGPEPLPVFGPITTRPASPLLPAGKESCPVYRQTECKSGKQRRCDLWDAQAGTWAVSPDPWAEQIFWYDRYYDLYHRMQGQQAEFLYVKTMPPGTPETVWGAPENFERYEGFWDSAGWTGTALQAAAARYRVTGTGADYGRMLDQAEALAFQYEATGVPGLLMRCHYAMLDEGAPPPRGHPGKALVARTPPENWEDHNLLGSLFVSRLPAYYRDGVDIDGKHWGVTAKWMGHASRDMYVRSLPGLMLAYDLLGSGTREDAIRAVVRTAVPCTLKRMKKMRIRHLQQNEEVRKAVSAYLGADRLQLDPGDIDLTALDTVYGFVLEEPRPDKLSAFDPACPAGPPLEVDPDYDLDAADEADFLARFVTILMRLDGQGDVPIAWIQVPSVRGADALYMAQWALAGLYLTGDSRFSDFLARLMDEVAFWPVVDTMGSFRMPRWCKPHYGPSLVYPTFWNLQNRVDRTLYPQFWRRLGRAIFEEFRGKELKDANDCYFGVLYDSLVDASIDPDAKAFVGRALSMLTDTGQYPAADRFEPRRSYDTDFLDHPPPGVTFVTEPLTAEDRALCEQPIVVFGMSLEPPRIEDDRPRVKEGLPIRFRIGGPFQWQEDPYQLARSYGDRNGRTQWPMSCFSVAYWTGRMQGTIAAGQGLVLGWREMGEACR
jgi:hypothetical protein